MVESNISEEEFRKALGAGEKPVSVSDVQKIMFSFPEIVRPVEDPSIIKPAGVKEVLAISSSEFTFTILREFPNLYKHLRTLLNAKDQQAMEDAKEYITYLEASLGEALKNSQALINMVKNDGESERD